MQQSTSDSAIINYFRNAGDALASECELLGPIIKNIVATQGHVTNKAIILYLIAELESTSDVMKQETLRKTLEIVVSRTPDNAGV